MNCTALYCTVIMLHLIGALGKRWPGVLDLDVAQWNCNSFQNQQAQVMLLISGYGLVV